MTEAEILAQFVCARKFSDLSREAREQLKIRIIDSLGCAIGALNADLISKIRLHIHDMRSDNLISLIGGNKSSPEHAAFFNSALVRYLDFNDSYLAPGETCHPSDNLGAVLAAAEFKDASGEDFLTALAIAYQVQCRLSDEAPVRAKGFDHTTQGAYAIAASVSKALGLNQEQTANAIAINGTSNLALRVTRTGSLSHWKGLAYAQAAFIGVHSTFLAMRDISGPLEVFEGNKGFKNLAGAFNINWKNEDLERVTKTILKEYNAEIHSQSCLEGALELKKQYNFSADEIDLINIEIFDVAYNIIGGGEEGKKTQIKTKEDADHSLRYLVAIAMLDSQVLPAQYAPERIIKDDVQKLMKKIYISPSDKYSKLFPEKMACSIKVKLKNGKNYSKEKMDYEGFFTRPFSFSIAVKKFEQLTSDIISCESQRKLISTIENLETLRVRDLTKLFSF